jgi:RNA polymerase sigma-70 factor, ECF subfamily
MPDDRLEQSDPTLTVMLNRMKEGDRQAGEEVVARVYDELHRIASREMRRERPGNTLQTTALIHEAYLRMAGAQGLEIQNRGHFFALASQQMRRVLVDYARAAGTQKRGGGTTPLDLDQVRVGGEDPDAQLVRLDDALRDLERLDPRPAKVVELKYFGGYSDREVAEALNLSLSTVRRDWEFARSWLFEQLTGPEKL